MSNTITNNVNRVNHDLLTKVAKNPTKDEFAKIAATKTRDAAEAAKPGDTQASLIARDPADASNEVKNTPPVKLDPPVKVDIDPKANADVSILPSVKPEPRPMSEAVYQTQNNDVWNWLENSGLSSITMEKKTLTANFTPGGPQTGTMTVSAQAPASTQSVFGGLKDLMSWFFGDMNPTQPMPPVPTTPPTPTPTPTPAPAPQPMPSPGVRPGFSMKWDASKFDAKIGTKVDVSMLKNSAKIDGTGPLPAVPVDNGTQDMGWQNMLASIFGGNSNNSLNIQLEQRKFNAIFDRPTEEHGTSAIA